jgi:hypothetical protein
VLLRALLCVAVLARAASERPEQVMLDFKARGAAAQKLLLFAEKGIGTQKISLSKLLRNRIAHHEPIFRRDLGNADIARFP